MLTQPVIHLNTKTGTLDIFTTCILQATSTILGELHGEINMTKFSLSTNYLDDKVLNMLQFMYISVRLQFFILIY